MQALSNLSFFVDRSRCKLSVDESLNTKGYFPHRKVNMGTKYFVMRKIPEEFMSSHI